MTDNKINYALFDIIIMALDDNNAQRVVNAIQDTCIKYADLRWLISDNDLSANDKARYIKNVTNTINELNQFLERITLLKDKDSILYK